MSTQTINDNKASLPDGIPLENTDLNEKEKERATHLFQEWDSVFSKSLADMGHTKLVNIKLNLVLRNHSRTHIGGYPLGSSPGRVTFFFLACDIFLACDSKRESSD